MAGIRNSALMVTADWEQLVSVELEAARVPILQKKSSHAQWKCQELLRRVSTLLAAGAAGHGLAPLLPALLCGPPVGQGEVSAEIFYGLRPRGVPAHGHCPVCYLQAAESTRLGHNPPGLPDPRGQCACRAIKERSF